MTRHRWGWAAILLFPAITCFDIASRLEHWPFSNYPMYSLVYSSSLSSLGLYGVTASGEVELRGDDEFAPFDQARLIMALNRLCAREDRDATLRPALMNLMKLYEERHRGGARLRGLRLYRVSWNLRAGLKGSEAPDSRTLIAETRE